MMINVLLITFLITLFYVAIANRLLTYVKVLAFQGVLLFGVVFIQLSEINTVNLILILMETIFFKSLAVPIFLAYILKRNKLTRESEPYLSNFISLIIVTGICILTILLVNSIKDTQLDKIFFVVALASIFTGTYFIVSRRKIITHVMGYLIVENGVFILSLALGSEMTMLVNTGIMMDIFVSVLVLGIFANRIGDTFEAMSVDNLTNLKD
jgi:hydrogenase-4 component E